MMEQDIIHIKLQFPEDLLIIHFFFGYLIRAGELYLNVSNAGIDTAEDRKVHLRNYPVF